ncbi:MAG TPA: c-type cytochrome [Gammaproteobacteria bacterium]|nr:c-type cytochrome [Gammaproteobacteria bacterium]
MDKADKQFFLTFLGVTGALVFITIVVLVAAKLVGGGPEEISTAQLKMAEERIQPIGKLNLQSSPAQPAQPVQVATATAAAAPADAGAQDTGSRVFGSICQACHMTGAAGAPVVGNKAAWAPRIAQGKDALYNSALNGKNAMPPKGGNPALSDAEVKAAVDYMVKQSKP